MSRLDDRIESPARGLQFGLWWRVMQYARPYRATVLGLAVAVVSTGICDSTLPLVTRAVVDHVIAEGSTAGLGRYAALFFAICVALSISVGTLVCLAGRLSAYVAHDIRTAGFARLQELSLSYYDRHPVGWVMARMTADCDRLARIVAWGFQDALWATTVMLIIATVMVWIHWQLALVALAVVPLLVLVSVRFQRVILQSARRVRKVSSRLTASYNEGLMGVRLSKVLTREPANQREFAELSTEMRVWSVRNAVQSAIYLPLVLTLGSIGSGLALWYGGLEVRAGAVSLGTLIAFIHYTGRFFEPVNDFAALFVQLQMGQAAAERTLGLIATAPEIADSAEVRRVVAAERSRVRSAATADDGLPTEFATIEFDDVRFGYAAGGRLVLDGFNLRVRAGETIALVGPTGGGKSTVVSLLCRFYEPTGGRVLFDGVDYRERSLEWLRSSVGVVLQTPHLFAGTVRDNIRYGRLDASDDEVEAAARLVDAHDFISELPRGYDAPVGEGGGRLSIGQRQLVSFARAVLRRPRILVMDEATSSVDAETEQRIQRALGAVLGGRTSFVIAHRLSTVRAADRILFIDGGRVVEAGSHRELLARRGRYHELYASQAVHVAVRAEATWRGVVA